MPGEQGSKGIKKKNLVCLNLVSPSLRLPSPSSLKSTATGNAAYATTIYSVIAKS